MPKPRSCCAAITARRGSTRREHSLELHVHVFEVECRAAEVSVHAQRDARGLRRGKDLESQLMTAPAGRVDFFHAFETVQMTGVQRFSRGVEEHTADLRRTRARIA